MQPPVEGEGGEPMDAPMSAAATGAADVGAACTADGDGLERFGKPSGRRCTGCAHVPVYYCGDPQG